MKASVIAVLFCLAAPVARAQEIQSRGSTYVRLAAGPGTLPYRFEQGGTTTTEYASGAGGTAEVGRRIGWLTLGVAASLARAEVTGQTDPSVFADVTSQTAQHTSAVVITRSDMTLGPVDLSIGVGLGAGLSTSVTLVDTGRSAVRNGLYSSQLETRPLRTVTPLFHVDISVGHTFGQTFVGVGTSEDNAVLGKAAGASRLDLVLRQSL